TLCRGHYFLRHITSISFFLLLIRPPPSSPLFPYTTLFRSCAAPARRYSAARRSRGRPRAADDWSPSRGSGCARSDNSMDPRRGRSEEHTSELQSPYDLVCRLLLEKKNKQISHTMITSKTY